MKVIRSSSFCYQQVEPMIVTLSINNKIVYCVCVLRPPQSTQNGFKTVNFFEEFSEFILFFFIICIIYYYYFYCIVLYVYFGSIVHIKVSKI